MLGISGGGRRVYELIVLRYNRSGEHVIDDMSTSPGYPRERQEGQKNWRGRVRCIPGGLGTYNSRRRLLLFVVLWVRLWQKGVSGRLLGLLPIRSTDESTEKSEDGELLTN